MVFAIVSAVFGALVDDVGTFLRVHLAGTTAIDFLVMPTVTFKSKG